MKKFLLFSTLFGGLLFTGCQQPTQSPQPAPQQPNIHVEVHPQTPTPPPMPLVQPPISPAPTRMYLFGYSDGYNGRIVTLRWGFWDYRQGWDLGRWDRAHNNPPRLP